MKIKQKFTTTGSGRIYFMSDLHYNHENVIRHDSRPFMNVTEMNKYIIDELSKTTPDDIIFDLGDMFWKMPVDDIKGVLDRIPCKNIYKVVGNHDNYGLYFDQAPLKSYFKFICDILDVHIEHQGVDYMVTMYHYPFVSWNHKPHGSIMIHGHCHGNIDQYNDTDYSLRVDVGFGSGLAKKCGSFLIPFEDIIDHFNSKTGGIDYKSWTLKNVKEL